MTSPRSARVPIGLLFLADGLLVGSWASRIPAVQRDAGVSTKELGLALFAASLGALVAMPVAGRLCERIGSRSIVIAAVLATCVALVLTAALPGLGGLAAGLFVFGAGFGSMNVSANAQGIALERLYGRSILSSFHAAYSAGGLAGAGLGAVAAGLGAQPLHHFAVVAGALFVVALAMAPRLVTPEVEDARPARRSFARPNRTLLLLGVAAFCTMLAEGAAADWSAVYLTHSLGAAAAVAALAYTAFSLAMATSRAVGDRLSGRLGPVTLVRASGLLAASGLGIGLAIGSTPVALAGFAAMGAGLGVVVPTLFRASASVPGISPSAGVAVVSTIGWLGFLAGPPAIGFAAGAVGLRAALVIVVAGTLALVLLARAAAPSGTRPQARESFRGLVIEPLAVLSDLDGVLVDSSGPTHRTWRRFADAHGLDSERVLAAMPGRRSSDLIRAVAPHLDAEAEAAIVDREELDDVDGIRALPGARELVESVPPGRFAIVTSCSRPLALARLRAAGLPVPETLVTADQVELGKPDPAGYLRAAALLGVDPAHCLVLEDAPTGVAAGVAAGMTVVAVLTTTDPQALQHAHSRVPTLLELLPTRAEAAA